MVELIFVFIKKLLVVIVSWAILNGLGTVLFVGVIILLSAIQIMTYRSTKPSSSNGMPSFGRENKKNEERYKGPLLSLPKKEHGEADVVSVSSSFDENLKLQHEVELLKEKLRVLEKERFVTRLDGVNSVHNHAAELSKCKAKARSDVRRGILWLEVLGQPRCKRPFGTKRMSQNT